MKAMRMDLSSSKPELLSPAGNMTCLRAAIQGGCDAVYFGLNALNMRSAADNFDDSELAPLTELCRSHGIKAYLTMNTMVYEHELGLAEETLRGCQGKVDAVICWDPCVIQLCRELGLPIHISTQACIGNSRAAAHYRDLGAERIIAARECSIEDIRRIREETGIEVEVFVHGAMCVSLSGRCFLSQFAYGKSGNRGECLQNCRREYVIRDKTDDVEFELRNDTILSAKDLCALPFLEQLLDAGVASLKIEGRNRNPEYVFTVTKAYRTAVDAWSEGRLDSDLKEELVADVQTVFNRDFSSGFFLGKPVDAFTDSGGNKATRSKRNVGKVLNYYPRAQAVEIAVQDNSFAEGDTLVIQGTTTGVVQFDVTEIRQDEIRVQEAARGIATVGLPDKVRENDKVYVLRKRA